MRCVLAILLNLAYLVAIVVYSPVVVYRMLFQKRYHRGWSNRLGFVPERRTERPCLWVHAVSVGEVNAIRPLVDHLRQQLPFYELLISTTTDTGFDRARTLFGDGSVFFLPFDFSFAMRRAFRRIKPAMVLLAELEVWPNMVIQAEKTSTPVLVVNGRLTERSVRRYGWLGPLPRWLFSKLTLVMVQDETYRHRFVSLGVPPERIVETGSLKWDSAKLSDLAAADETIADAVGLDVTRPVLVAGSTVETQEEEAILRAWQQVRSRFGDLQLIIAPRKPERFDQVAGLIRARGFTVIRRSEHADGTVLERTGASQGTSVVLVDTIGDLRRFYTLASVVIVGRTFVPYGGSDVMEIAAAGKAMIMGPYVDNFADAVGKLLENDAAIQLESIEPIGSTIAGLLSDRDELDALSHRARDVVAEQQGATSRTVREICKLLDLEYDTTGRGIATPQLHEQRK